ncbi:MAG: BamA/TamA family outer membrane protein [Bacteroidia bacterium]
MKGNPLLVFPLLPVVLIVLVPLAVLSQGTNLSRELIVYESDEDLDKLIAPIRKDLLRAADSAALFRALVPLTGQMQKKGYASFGVSQFHMGTDTLAITFSKGPLYLYDYIELGGLNDLYREKTGIENLVQKRRPVHWSVLNKKLFACAEIYQNEGYPFASFQGLSLSYRPSGDTLFTGISYPFDPGPLIRIDSIRIKGQPRESAKFIYSLIRVSPGSPFSQELIDGIPRLLNNSIYYQNAGRPEIVFTPFHTARIDISLEKKQAGRFDVLLGILPPSANTQKLSFTGTMDIVLVSPFRQGEIISFKYNKLIATSQQVEAKVMAPYLFGFPLKIEGTLNLLKQEEDFLNLDYQGSIFYEFSPYLSARFFLHNRNSRLLDAAIADTVKGNPAQLDGLNQTLGAGLNYEKLDYRQNPSRGVSAALDFGLGRNIIRENVLLIRKNPEIYEGLDLRQPSREINLRLKWYYSFLPRHVIYLGNHTYWLGMETYLRNNQLQAGGSRSIRGFNENQFFTDFYTFFTGEYRFQLERDSYMFIFGDYAYLENNEAGQVYHPSGVGLGMNYGTKAGIVSITYAVGKVEGFPFQPSRGKIHIGLVNQF